LAWIGLVPLLLALDGQRPRRAYFLGYLTGVGFFAGTLYWFIHVTVLGEILLVLYLSNYFAVFTLGFVLFKSKKLWQALIFYPSLWVGLELLRGWLFTGFGWVSLGYSQYKVLPVIQIADITGMLGVTFLIVMVNVLLKEMISEAIVSNRNLMLKKYRRPIVTVTIILISVLSYGWVRLQQTIGKSAVEISAVQANIQQEIKRDSSEWSETMRQYLSLTKKAVAQHPDLIVWPETAFPGYVWEAPEMFEDLKRYVGELQTPLLLGLVTKNNGYFNSAILISPSGEVVQQYDKLHLVPFGEYIPARKWLPFVYDFLPIEDFTPGKQYTLFPLVPRNAPPESQPIGSFGVLICFEDTVARISRGFVLAGANMLMNITNDAWFKDTNSPFLHLQGSVFRSVENRRSLVRAANTGVSCFIDSAGRIYRTVHDQQGKVTYVAGYQKAAVALQKGLSFYTRFGDVFAYLCLAGICFGLRFFKHY